MHAALITGAHQVEIRDFAEPTPTDVGVVVDISFCGVCGTDIHAYTSGRAYRPAICGHEWTGTVSAIGGSVRRVAEGDRVIVGVPAACGSCEACRAGHLDHCLVSLSFALGRDPGAPPHGGFAPRIAVDEARVLAAHPDLDDETLAQVEPVTVSLHAVRRSALREGDLTVVQGAGPVGLTTMQCARAGGAGEIIVIEPGAARRAMALTLGATAAIGPEMADEFVRERSRGLGADIVYECAGRAETIQSAVDLARKGGSMCLIGLVEGDAVIDPSAWLRKEITVTSALAYLHQEFELAMDMIADGRIRVDLLHSSTTGLDGLAAALDDLAEGRSAQTKVLVNPNW